MNWLKHLLGRNEGDNRPNRAIATPAFPEVPTYAAAKGEDERPVFTGSVASDALARSPAPNLVDGINALAEYYRYVEAEAYDRGLKTMREHRDFREEFLRRAEALLVYEGDNDARNQIQHALEKELVAFRGLEPFRADAAQEARSRDPDGYALLGLTAPLTFDSLKNAYRRAALAYHPDVGGDEGTMRKVNDTYELFTALLRRQVAEENALQQPQASRDNAQTFFETVRFSRFSMLLDDLNADAAFEAYSTLSVAEMERQFRSWETVSRLCELLAACTRAEEAKQVLHDLGTLVDDGEARGLTLRPVYRKTSEACCDPESIRFIPNHVRQADNLLRLGVIDKRRYDAILKRIGDAVEKISEGEAAFELFAKSYRFLELPMDPLLTSDPQKGLVPGPDYYARVETLSEPQRSEYARAFHGGAAELAMKYMAVRMDALLRAPFLGYTDINSVLVELKALDTAPGMKSGLRVLCDEALKIVSFIAAMPPIDRERRIAALKGLDANPGPLTLTISVGGRIGADVLVLPRPIIMNPSYTAFATAPMERIERYLKTGSELTPAEQEVQRENWEASRAFHESEIYKRARDATWKRRDPEKIIEAVSALCEAMYDRARDAQDRSLEIGYWTDKLTIALVKLKRFDEALQWIQRYDDTPESIKGRDSRGVLEALSRRKARCESSLKQ